MGIVAVIALACSPVLLTAALIWLARLEDRARTKERRELQAWMDAQQLPDDVRAVIWRANDRINAERELYF